MVVQLIAFSTWCFWSLSLQVFRCLRKFDGMWIEIAVLFSSAIKSMFVPLLPRACLQTLPIVVFSIFSRVTLRKLTKNRCSSTARKFQFSSKAFFRISIFLMYQLNLRSTHTGQKADLRLFIVVTLQFEVRRILFPSRILRWSFKED